MKKRLLLLVICMFLALSSMSINAGTYEQNKVVQLIQEKQEYQSKMTNLLLLREENNHIVLCSLTPITWLVFHESGSLSETVNTISGLAMDIYSDPLTAIVESMQMDYIRYSMGFKASKLLSQVNSDIRDCQYMLNWYDQQIAYYKARV